MNRSVPELITAEVDDVFVVEAAGLKGPRSVSNSSQASSESSGAKLESSNDFLGDLFNKEPTYDWLDHFGPFINSCILFWLFLYFV